MYLVHPGILSFDRPPKDSSRHCSTHCRSDHRIDKQSIVTLSANWTPLCKLYSSSLRENVIQRLLSASGVFFSNLIFWETNGGWVGCFLFCAYISVFFSLESYHPYWAFSTYHTETPPEIVFGRAKFNWEITNVFHMFLDIKVTETIFSSTSPRVKKQNKDFSVYRTFLL